MIQHIANATGISPVPRGEHTFLIRLNDADVFLSGCAKRGVIVLGIDVFDVVPDGIMPDMNSIADFSALSGLPDAERCARSIAEAKSFLELVPRGDRLLDFQLSKQQNEADLNPRANQ